MLRVTLIILAILILSTVVVATIYHAKYRAQRAETLEVWSQIEAMADSNSYGFDPESVSDLPEIAQRYFNHAIAPGTPLAKTVELDMSGVFHLGDAAAHKTFAMEARQILSPPWAFVWLPTLKSGPMTIMGADSYFDGQGAMHFWMQGLIPLVQVANNEDINHAAAMRPMIESVWSPASLLPENGAIWTQTGPDTAEIRFANDPYDMAMNITLSPEGTVQSVVGMRWSDANSEKIYRLQPFGGRMLAEKTFGGYTIPSQLEVGNHFGTDDFFAFFVATVGKANFQ